MYKYDNMSYNAVKHIKKRYLTLKYIDICNVCADIVYQDTININLT